MAEPWEEALDLDDSDLSSLRPFKRRKQHATTTTSAAAAAAAQPFLQRCSFSQSSQTLPSQNHQNLLSQFRLPPSVSPRLIPGPAGTVQAAMLRRRSNRNDEKFAGDSIPTQEYIRRVAEDGAAEDDDDFTHDPSLCAVDFIRSEGLAYGDGAIGTPLSVIKSRNNMDKVHRVVAIVKSCTPNGLGDMMVTLKVAVFSPSHYVHYLNITIGNMIKVISKEGRFSPTQICSAPIVKHAAPASEYSERIRMPEKRLSLLQGRTEGIMNSLIQNANRKGSSRDVEQIERNRTHGVGSNERNQNDFARRELLASQNEADEAIEVIDGTDRGNNDIMVSDHLNHSSQAGRGNILDGAQHGDAAAGSVDAFNSQKIGNVDETKGRKPPTSRVEVPQWTDEQLDKLFELDHLLF